MSYIALCATLLSVLVRAASASECPAGSFSSNGQTPCTQCSPGTFQPNNGQRSCQEAQAGWHASGHGATSQQICQQGSFSEGGAAECTICPPGSYCNGQGQTRPQLCPRGHYAPKPGLGQQCLECPRGTFVNIEGATACCNCCSGFYTDQTSQDHCFPCPVRGAFSPVGATSASQCANKPGGGLNTCAMSGDTCPNTGGSFPSGAPRQYVRRAECPRGHQSCPVYGTRMGVGYLKEFECVDVRNDLESCGGCASTGAGKDCSAIPHVDSVTCRKGSCVVGQCAPGYVVSPSGSSCVPSLNVQSRYRRGAF
ncbi:hypothetical protein C8Q78DRAFT_1079033 [Trametes maxima]|nr:hypothetical protein C8Q78DRAFT_1079033 [Trametes maxima]